MIVTEKLEVNPAKVHQGSSLILNIAPSISFCSSSCSTIWSAFTIIERNLYILNGLPSLPILSCGEVAEYTDYDKQRLEVMPGCTGLWQVTKRNEADFDEMVWLDIIYINHSGLWEDFKILVKVISILYH